MTENEYKMCQTKLKQIRENISDLRSEEQFVLRKMSEYQYKSYENRYFFDEESDMYFKTIGANENEYAVHINFIGYFYSKNAFNGEMNFYTDSGFFTHKEFYDGNVIEITEEEYKQKVEEAINKVKEYLL